MTTSEKWEAIEQAAGELFDAIGALTISDLDGNGDEPADVLRRLSEARETQAVAQIRIQETL